MQLSKDRFLTTHVGSLPRPPELAEMLLCKDQGEDLDAAAFEVAVRDAVAQAVDRQTEVGIDIVSDGEMGKVGYATYIHERLSGFGGHADRKVALDLKPYPQLREKMGRIAGKQSFVRSVCVAPVAVKDEAPVRTDIDNLKDAIAGKPVVEAFINSASPGLVSAFQPNQYYPTHEAYVEAVADAMRAEYEAIVEAGFLLQLDCPDLAMARHTGFQDLSEAEFLKRAAFHVEVMNHALEGIPSDRLRMHVCWGNYEGPHDHDIAFEKVLPIVLEAKPQAILFEAANPRHEHEWSVWRDIDLPEDKVLIPGLIASNNNYVEHPLLVAERLERFADIVGRERVIAGTDCGFGTFAGVGKMDPEVSYKKLKALSQGAEMASQRLW